MKFATQEWPESGDTNADPDGATDVDWSESQGCADLTTSYV